MGSKTFKDEFCLAIGSAFQNILFDLAVLTRFHDEAIFYFMRRFDVNKFAERNNKFLPLAGWSSEEK
jgi:hypothetical protein